MNRPRRHSVGHGGVAGVQGNRLGIMANRHTPNPRYRRTSPKVVVNVTADEKAALEAAAKELGITVSEVVRRALRVTGAL